MATFLDRMKSVLNTVSSFFTFKKKSGNKSDTGPLRKSEAGLYFSSLDPERQGIGRKEIGAFVITENAQGKRTYNPADSWTTLKNGAGLGSKEQMVKDMLAHEARLSGGETAGINISIDDALGPNKPQITDKDRQEFLDLVQALREERYSLPVYGAPDVKFTVSKGPNGENIYTANRPLDEMNRHEKDCLVRSIAAHHKKTDSKEDFTLNMVYSSKEKENTLKQADLSSIQNQKEHIKNRAKPEIVKRSEGKNWAFTVSQDPEGKRIYTSVNDWATLNKSDQDNMLKAIYAYDEPRQVNMWGRLDPIVIVSSDAKIQAKEGERVQQILSSMALRDEVEDYESRKRDAQETAPHVVSAGGIKVHPNARIPTVADFRTAQAEKATTAGAPPQLATDSILIPVPAVASVSSVVNPSPKPEEAPLVSTDSTPNSKLK